VKLNSELGRAPLLRPFFASLSVVLGHVVVMAFAVAQGIDDQGPAVPCLGGTYGDGNTCYATWGKWSPLMYAPEIGLIGGIVVASILRRHPGRWICSLGFVGAALCVFAVIATNSGATWQMPLP
jgi:hypothetical protein